MKLEVAVSGRQSYPAAMMSHLFRYDSGKIYWKNKAGSRSPITIGSEAGTTFGHKRYRTVNILGKKILTHHIVFAMHNQRWAGEIDHINGDGSDNRIENLREVNRSQNSMNRTNRSDNASGLKGARVRKTRGGGLVWTSSIHVDGKSVYLGRYKTPEDAHEAYKRAAVLYFGEFHNDGK